MNLIFACETVFGKFDGKYYSADSSFSMSLWQRYLEEFDSVSVVARVENLDAPGRFEIDGSKVSVIELPRYRGIRGSLKAPAIIRRAVAPFVERPDTCFINRVPGVVGQTVGRLLRSRGLNYSVEVVGDPWDVMDSIGGALRWPLKIYGYTSLSRAVRNAGAALYVTRRKLQDRYPVSRGVPQFSASDVRIPVDGLAAEPRVHSIAGRPVRLLAIGSLAQLYKAPDVVLKAIAHLKTEGVQARLVWLGDGCYRKPMQQLADDLGIADSVDFRGNVGRDVVDRECDEADIFVHVSRTEGLPRAIVEAMARALPVIGTPVGGIPELVDKSTTVPVGKTYQLAQMIRRFIDNPGFYNRASRRSLDIAREFEESKLAAVRHQFFSAAKSLP